MRVLCVSGCYSPGVVGVVVEVPFPYLEVLHDMVGMYGQQEVKSLSDVSTWVHARVTLLAPS